MSVLEIVDSSYPNPSLEASDTTTKAPAKVIAKADDLVDQIIATVGKNIVLGAPLAIGKPVSFVNALYQRAKKDPSINLRIETGITLEKPVGKSKIERGFLEPLLPVNSMVFLILTTSWIFELAKSLATSLSVNSSLKPVAL